MAIKFSVLAVASMLLIVGCSGNNQTCVHPTARAVEIEDIDKIDRLLNRLERVSIKHWWYDEWTTPIIKTYQLNGVRVVVTPHGDIKVDDWRINTQRDQTVRAIELFDCVTTKMGVSMDIAIDEALK